MKTFRRCLMQNKQRWTRINPTSHYLRHQIYYFCPIHGTHFTFQKNMCYFSFYISNIMDLSLDTSCVIQQGLYTGTLYYLLIILYPDSWNQLEIEVLCAMLKIKSFCFSINCTFKSCSQFLIKLILYLSFGEINAL